jgi:hypothetical protein
VTNEPTLADDEARLAEIASALEVGLVQTIPGWLRRSALTVRPSIDAAALDASIVDTMAALEPELHRILVADVDAGAGSPLAAIRAATGAVTQLLLDDGALVPTRDEFAERSFPGDLFSFGPAAFAEIDEALHEPGLVWGAARAHVHLRRRRELDQ